MPDWEEWKALSRDYIRQNARADAVWNATKTCDEILSRLEKLH